MDRKDLNPRPSNTQLFKFIKYDPFEVHLFKISLTLIDIKPGGTAVRKFTNQNFSLNQFLSQGPNILHRALIREAVESNLNQGILSFHALVDSHHLFK